MENRPPSGHEFRFGDSDDESSEETPKQRRGELRLPRVPLSESARPAPASEARPSFDIAAFLRQQREADEARRMAEAVAKQQEKDDEDEAEDDTPATARPEGQAAEAPEAASELNNASAGVDTVEAEAVVPPTEAADGASMAQVSAESEAAAVDAAQPTASSSQEGQPSTAAPTNEELPVVDPVALEQLQQEAEAYANSLLTDAELAPAPEGAESTEDTPEGEAESGEATAEVVLAPDDAEEDEDDEASTTAATTSSTASGSSGGPTIPRPRSGSGASTTAPVAPPPLMPIPIPGGTGSSGRGVPGRPRSGGTAGSSATPSSGGGGGTSGSTRGYGGGGGGGGFGAPIPGMGPTGPNVLNTGANLAGNLAGNMLHSHEHWHPKTFLALAGAILVSHMLGKRRDRMITHEMRERTDQLKQIIDQNTAQTEQQQARLKREAAEAQESYETARRKLASRLEQVETQQARQAAETTVAVGPMAGGLERAPLQPRPTSTERANNLPGQRVASAERPGMVPAANVFESGSDRAIAPELVPDTQRFAELNARPNVVAEQVAQAAELGVSTEKIYERRQEVRDEPGAGGQQGGGAASVGSIFDSGASYQPQQAVSRQLADAQAQLSQGQGYQRPDGDMYRKAIQAGFWGGVVVIVLAIIAVFAL